MAILKHILLIGTLMFLTTGCFTDFEPDIKSTPVLCMNSTITPGDTIDVLLTRTWRWDEGSPNKDMDILVTNAEVKLYVNEEYIEQLSFSKLPNYDPYASEDRLYGYRSTYIPKEGDKIKLTAHSDKYGDASAEVTVPHHIDITHVEYNNPIIRSSSDGSYKYYHFSLDLLVWFTDRPSTTDYYRLSVSNTNPKSYGIPNSNGVIMDCYARIDYYNVNYDREPLFTEHVSPLESAVSETSGYSIFSDRQISGKEYPLHISIVGIKYSINNPENNPELETASINLNLDVISQSYYDHVLSVWAHNDGINGILGDVGLADPVRDGSNVSTGAGVVAAKSTSTYKIYLQNIVKEED